MSEARPKGQAVVIPGERSEGRGPRTWDEAPLQKKASLRDIIVVLDPLLLRRFAAPAGDDRGAAERFRNGDV